MLRQHRTRASRLSTEGLDSCSTIILAGRSPFRAADPGGAHLLVGAGVVGGAPHKRLKALLSTHTRLDIVHYELSKHVCYRMFNLEINYYIICR